MVRVTLHAIVTSALQENPGADFNVDRELSQLWESLPQAEDREEAPYSRFDCFHLLPFCPRLTSVEVSTGNPDADKPLSSAFAGEVGIALVNCDHLTELSGSLSQFDVELLTQAGQLCFFVVFLSHHCLLFRDFVARFKLTSLHPDLPFDDNTL